MQQAVVSVLPPSVVGKIRSDTHIASFTQAVCEVVANSLDARARAVEVAIDPQQLSFAVDDDGCGIPSASMPSVGLRFTTSKLQRLEQLPSVRTLGFKGEALASLAEVCTLEISSRCLGKFDTFEKVIRGGQAVRCGPSLGQARPRAGTTVRARGIFFNQGVRQRQAMADRWGMG
jgi:DNA mismatch repair protein MLH3